jgi:hypothetical protein
VQNEGGLGGESPVGNLARNHCRADGEEVSGSDCSGKSNSREKAQKTQKKDEEKSHAKDAKVRRRKNWFTEAKRSQRTGDEGLSPFTSSVRPAVGLPFFASIRVHSRLVLSLPLRLCVSLSVSFFCVLCAFSRLLGFLLLYLPTVD